MPYTTTTVFQNSFKHRVIATWPGTTAFTQMITDQTADFNRYLDVTSDICSTSDNTAESNFITKSINNLLEENLKYMEKQASQGTGGDSVVMAPPSLWDVAHLHVREGLKREKREEKPRATNYNLRTGRIRHWYG